MKDKGCTMSTVGLYLMAIGAINWGLVGVSHFFGSDWNIVHTLLGSWMTVEYAVYVLVGIAGVMSVMGCKCATCKAAMPSA